MTPSDYLQFNPTEVAVSGGVPKNSKLGLLVFMRLTDVITKNVFTSTLACQA